MFQWLWNLFGIGFGIVFGCILGLSVGPFVFPDLLKPKEFNFLDESADADDDIQVRPPSRTCPHCQNSMTFFPCDFPTQAPDAGTPVCSSMRSLLEYAEPWTTSPDYQRVGDHTCQWDLLGDGRPSLWCRMTTELFSRHADAHVEP